MAAFLPFTNIVLKNLLKLSYTLIQKKNFYNLNYFNKQFGILKNFKIILLNLTATRPGHEGHFNHQHVLDSPLVLVIFLRFCQATFLVW